MGGVPRALSRAARYPSNSCRGRDDGYRALPRLGRVDGLRMRAPPILQLLRHGHQLEHVAVGILEVDAAAAAPIVELAVPEMGRIAAIGEALGLDAAEDGVELGVAHVEGVVVAGDLAVLVAEEQRHLVVDAHRREVADGLGPQSEQLGEEARGLDLVARGNDGVVEHDGHDRFLPDVLLIWPNCMELRALRCGEMRVLSSRSNLAEYSNC